MSTCIEHTIIKNMSKGQVTTGVEDFDWAGLGKHDEIYTPEQRAEMEASYGDSVSSIAQHEVIEGTIVLKTKRELVINIGYKSEGVISISEFRYNPELAQGDTVEVYVENPEDRTGQLVLSHQKARAIPN